ncbi:MAG: aminotransferase class III-fold pyridoxal phosphate-dependent enzyme [Gammaproteobacteria bacterium]|nr:aminotransferase class III-fold pyridoxal phosphate-dependent enzyme [Pseudomonadales bacterium]MCP5348963.1 aminotransferase class III-fold pyridoxal phosphate-dependent enzyme [Pseudomonadales bacterium]
MKKIYQYSQSRALFERARRVIPNGIPGHFNPAVQKPAGTYPYFVARAAGARFWDVDGNQFIDYMCGYGPMILGYDNPVVEEAVRAQVSRSDTCSLASPIMVELAEFLVDLIPMADWAYFAKNGADATNMAILIARAATGRRKVIAIEGGYHGSSPWMQAPGRTGITAEDHAEILRIPWNDLAALHGVLDEHQGEIAAFIASPYHHPVNQDNQLPADGYWQAVHKLLKQHGIVSICDDVRAGFRLDMRGSHEYFGYTPDLSCYCKAIANGYPISALVGIDSLRDTAAAIFQTGSFWFSAGPMAAALVCLQELQRLDAPTRILATGRKLLDGLVNIAREHGHELIVSGMPSMPYLRLAHEDGIGFHQALCGECTRRGVFLTSHHNLFISAAHSDADLQLTWDVFDDALASI